jgi:excisionase family DNA binding protein
MHLQEIEGEAKPHHDRLPKPSTAGASAAKLREQPVVPLAFRLGDAAKAAGLSRTSIYRLIRGGRLRVVRVAGRKLIPAESLKALLASGDA